VQFVQFVHMTGAVTLFDTLSASQRCLFVRMLAAEGLAVHVIAEAVRLPVGEVEQLLATRRPTLTLPAGRAK
jgi:hypothetical protein